MAKLTAKVSRHGPQVSGTKANGSTASVMGTVNRSFPMVLYMSVRGQMESHKARVKRAILAEKCMRDLS